MTDERGPVLALYESLIGAWNERDAGAMAALYAPHGSQIGFDGSAFDGPHAIEAALAPIFRDHPTARFVTIVREIRAIGSDALLLRAVAGMIPPGARQIKPEVNAIQSLVAHRHNGAWKIELFQNTPAAFHGRPDDAAALTRELQQAADHPPPERPKRGHHTD
ncbi:SgcJ/EcaC family oxidoreductase [Sphingosinicella sp. BN140058]|uniref:SgcJ/EcaC family oxidoreductase n=1 Tax=Sphingosinicella sp. BN140058 TaxID=1892855 RepID=UPI0010125184|nr:SgcJ/EcaC family oxidoreductase [Sphingosinicella sp. BN140058]QAY78855.1 SgcJ/EcaC family oxidoreductase [Sphingosinicella sp. BN140058]